MAARPAATCSCASARPATATATPGSDLLSALRLGPAGLASALLAVAALWFCYRDSLSHHFADTYYQSHFLFLWGFFGVALWKAGRGRLRSRFGASGRDVLGLAAVLIGLALYRVGLVTGSSAVQRLSLVCVFAAWSLLAWQPWSIRRCLAYTAFLLLCFGIPYSVYFDLTRAFRRSFMSVLEATRGLLGLDCTIDGLTLVFPHYRLDITPDCSGFNQLITFLGLAFLGSLTGRTRAGRAALLFGLGVALAYVANLSRVLVFAVMVDRHQVQVVDDPVLHQIVGMAAYAPFILSFVWVILRTHSPRLATPPAFAARGAVPQIVLLVPFLLLRLLAPAPVPPSAETPAFMRGLEAPPGYRLVARSAREQAERMAYDTPHLINVRFAAADDGAAAGFELFAYSTRSKRHLSVHQISQCLDLPDQTLRYGPAVTVAGRTFWSLELHGPRGAEHGFFAFSIDGEDYDDSARTQLAVLGKRLLGGAPAIALTRLLFPGPLQLPLPDGERAVLEWRVRLLADRG